MRRLRLISKTLSPTAEHYETPNEVPSNKGFQFKQINSNTLKVTFPRGATISGEFLKKLDQDVKNHSHIPCKILIVTNGILDVLDCAQPYLIENAHTQIYQAVAFVQKLKGDMAILENHYIRQFIQNNRSSQYYKSIFKDETAAIQWLASI